MSKIFVGIDPGLDGAIAAVSDDGSFISVTDTPSLETVSGTKKKPKIRRRYNTPQMARILLELCTGSTPVFMLELVHAMPEQGISSAFTMGQGVGAWEGCMAMFCVSTIGGRFSNVTPQRWKKLIMQDLNKGTKASSIYRASQLFPTAPLSLKKHDGRADALLIAEYCRRTYNQNSPQIQNED